MPFPSSSDPRRDGVVPRNDWSGTSKVNHHQHPDVNFSLNPELLPFEESRGERERRRGIFEMHSRAEEVPGGCSEGESGTGRRDGSREMGKERT